MKVTNLKVTTVKVEAELELDAREANNLGLTKALHQDGTHVRVTLEGPTEALQIEHANGQVHEEDAPQQF